MLGEPALHLLWRRKLRGSLRRQFRRMRSPKGILLGLFGAGLILLWISSLFFYTFSPGRGVGTPETVAQTVRAGGLLLTFITLASSLNHRGLYLPAEEIERLFSAPVSRSDLVRYRLVANLGRSMIGGLVFGVMFMGRTPRPTFGFLALLSAMATLPILGQTGAILSGGIEKRFMRYVKGPAKALLMLMVPVLVLFGWGLATQRFEGKRAILRKLQLATPETVTRLLETPVARAVLLPFEPWARAASATTHAQFWPWLLVCLVIWYALFELTARLPLDFRELSLETAANTAERVRRVRRVGGGASATKAVRGRLGRRPPWIFGHGPGGAIAWRKWVEILRKARGTLWVSALVLFALMLVSGSVGSAVEERGTLAQVAVTAVLGTLYLCSGLRFDFRDDLDRMESIKSWPLSARRLFACSLLPETLLVSLLLWTAVGLRLLLSEAWDAGVPVVAVYLPLVVFAWLALDNAVFLFAPVRFVPGQDGALQNAGRAILLVFLRMFMLALVLGLVGGISFGLWTGLQALGIESPDALGLMVLIAGWLVLLGVDVGLVAVGGWLLGRFDVARDRG